ncbi:hypothetical protein LTS08_002535 [Lithohypha guttulata]|uniref:uncharacterized protein n=1 Tax=Lithohypha guttulata TaxID=1690604 RepID=UPI002DE1D4F3|nr:hypothetical protein LTR51_001705 [Lithohypha guttulata]KAK5104644.1 hypothetical protein LTS08_002535 [Lithohypha guttulata]
MGSMGGSPQFRTIQSFTPDYCPNRITQYESKRTGMRVVVVDQEGPKLHGFFVLATEIHDDSGAPHTLEHLCFMGSKSYKYKGFLDKLATRAYAGTNAWTATDHTAYTLETAGWAGFRQILPVYLEHVILPTLTDSGCLTEVHHIDGKGLDAGVVYSEMQGVQNTAQELIDLRSKRLLYPQGSGFRYETGGMMEQLRVLTADRIRQFHRDMYQPRNLCLCLFGEINHDELLETLSEFETSITDDIPDPGLPFQRPWIDSEKLQPLTESTVEVIEFPEEDESMGQIDIRFLGPNCADSLQISALQVVLLYLAGSSAAVLDNTLVEKEQIASGVYYSIDSRPKTEITFSLSGVAAAKLEQVEARFFEVLKGALDKPLDMSFMQDCLEQQTRTFKFDAETSATAFVNDIISDYLFGNRDGSTLASLKNLDDYDVTLKAWTETEWKTFIKRYISDANHVSMLGKPSAALSEKFKADEAKRIEEQQKKLGPEGLKECERKLEAAKAENDREIPHSLLAKFRVPPIESIHFVTTSSARIGPALAVGRPSTQFQSIIEADDKDMPLFIDFEHIPSNFARVNLIISTEHVPIELRPLIPVYLEAFFNLPIQRGDKVVDFEQVVIELERETVGYNIETASGLGNSECLRIEFEVEVEKYSDAIRWMKELMWHSIFDIERLKAINSRLLADVPDYKRSGNGMLTACHLMLHLAPESIARAKSTLTKALYLKRTRALLKSDPERLVSQMEAFRKTLCQFPNFRVLVVADLEKLENPVSSWRSLLSDLAIDPAKPPPLAPLGSRLARLSPAGLSPGKSSHVIPMATIDSSYAYAVARGPTSYDDPKLPALMVAMAYLNAVEGPLWTAVRGTGLAYGTSMSYDIHSGFINIDVYRSPDAYKAFLAARDVIGAHIDGTTPFDSLMLEGAISSIVVGFANEQGTLASAAVASFVRQVMRGLPEDYMQIMLKKVRDIDVEAIKQSLKDVVFDVFTPGKSDVLVTCATGLTEQIKTGLGSLGYQPEVHDLNWFQDDYGLKTGEDDEAEEDDDDDDEDEDEDDDGDESGNDEDDEDD